MAQRIREMKEKFRRQMDGMENGQDYAISETTNQQPEPSHGLMSAAAGNRPLNTERESPLKGSRPLND